MAKARPTAAAAKPRPATDRDLKGLRDELDKVKRDLIAANLRVRELEASRTEALDRLDTVIRSISGALKS